jgi:hypothetical protein
MEDLAREVVEHLAERHYLELFGFASAIASLYAFSSRTIIPLRIAAILANVFAIAYSASRGTYPTLALNVILLPLNVVRLRAMWKLVHDVEAANSSDLNVEWLRPYMRPKNFKPGDFLMRQGEVAGEAFYIITGEAELVEIDKSVGPGTLLGEIGLFAPGNRRTMSVRCRTAVTAATISYEQFKELYYQNPQFGFAVLRLIVARLHGNAELSRQSNLS